MLLRKPGQIAAFLAVLTSVGPISTDMYLPAFPAMRAALGGSFGSSQQTLAAWFLGLSIGQVTFGPLSDHFGRRRPLLIGTVIYGIASVGCACAQSFAWLSFFRVIAAFGGAASLVIPRAIIRDLVHDNLGAARLISTLILVMGVVPVLAPTIGSLIAAEGGWRAIFLVAALYGLGCGFAIWRKLPDTLPRGRRMRQRPASVLVTYGRILADRTFLTHTLEGSLATFSLFAFLGGVPVIMEEGFGLTPVRFGLLFVFFASGYIVGAKGNARLMPRFGPDRLLTLAVIAMLFSTVAMVVASIGESGVLGVVLPAVAFMTALGFVLPGAAIGSILPHAGRAGSASALYGTVVFLIGAGGTVLVGLVGSVHPEPMGVVMAGGAMLALVMDRLRPRVRSNQADAVLGVAATDMPS